MAQINLLSSVLRSGSYPVSVDASTTYNCGMLLLELGGTWTEQMISELPAINVQIFLDADTVYSSFEINMRTVSEQFYKNPTEPYVIPIYDIPNAFTFKLSPIFDNNAIMAHNNNVECGNVESFTTTENGIVDSQDVSIFLWTTPTDIFDITITFDNSNVQSGGSSGGGGGGGGTAASISFDPTGTSLTSTNVQDAIDELYLNQPITTTQTYMLLANSWSNSTYTIQDQSITADSTIYINLPTTITLAEYTAIGNANIVAGAQSAGSIQLKCFGTVPTIDVPVVLTITN